MKITCSSALILLAFIQCSSSQKTSGEQSKYINNITYADVNKFDRNGVTALMAASAEGNEPLMRTLLQSGAYVNQADHGGRHALIYTTQGCHQKAFNFLVEHAGQMQRVDVGGRSALFYSAMYGCWGITEFIAKTTKSIDQQDKRGMTPLMVAARYHRVEVVRLLLENGAEVNAQDYEGKTALYHAVATPVWLKHERMERTPYTGSIKLTNNSEVNRPDYDEQRGFFGKVWHGIKSIPRRTANLFRKLFNKPVKKEKNAEPAIKLKNLEIKYAFQQVEPAGGTARTETIRALRNGGALSTKKDIDGVSIMEFANKYKMNDILPLL